jgi:hypothetical protein
MGLWDQKAGERIIKPRIAARLLWREHRFDGTIVSASAAGILFRHPRLPRLGNAVRIHATDGPSWTGNAIRKAANLAFVEPLEAQHYAHWFERLRALRSGGGDQMSGYWKLHGSKILVRLPDGNLCDGSICAAGPARLVIDLPPVLALGDCVQVQGKAFEYIRLRDDGCEFILVETVIERDIAAAA